MDSAVYARLDLPYLPVVWPLPVVLAVTLSLTAVLGRHRCRTCANRWRPPTDPRLRSLATRCARFTWTVTSPVLAVVTSGCGALLLAAMPIPGLRLLLVLPPLVLWIPFEARWKSTAAFWATAGLFWGALFVGSLVLAALLSGGSDRRGAIRRTLSWYAGVSVSILMLYLGGYATLRGTDRVEFHTEIGIAHGGLGGGPYLYVVPKILAPGIVQLMFLPMATWDGETFHVDSSVRFDPMG